VPVSLSRNNPREPFKLKRDSDDLELSATLRHRLKELDVNPEMEEEHEYPSAYLGALAPQISASDRSNIRNEAYLATFASSKLRMWQDLEELKGWSEEKLPPLISGFAGGEVREPDGTGDTPSALPPDENLKGGGLDDELPIRDQRTVVDADYSQLKAIHAVLQGGHLVIHGPPGTGKSQTITNIISSLLAAEKKVLFVSEKRAALDVVKRNLEKCQLGELCLDLHSKSGKKNNVYEQLKLSLNSSRRGERMDTSSLEQISSAREKLNEYVRELHKPRGILEESIYNMTGRYAAVQDSQTVEGLNVPSFGSLSRRRFAACRKAADRLSDCEREFKRDRTSPWAGLREPESPIGFMEDLLGEFREIQKKARKMYESSKYISTELDVPTPNKFSESCHLGELCKHLNLSPGIEQSWLDDEKREQAKDSVSQARDSYREQKDLATQSRRFFSTAPGGVTEIRDRLTSVVAAVARNDVCRDWKNVDALTQLRQASLGELCQAMDTVLKQKKVIGRQLPEFSFGNEWNALADAAKLLGRVLTLGSVPPRWLQEPENILVECKEFEQRAQRLDDCEQDLFERFFEAIVDDIDDVFAYRFRNDYQEWYRWFQSDYRKDMRVLQGHLKIPGKIPYLEAYELIRSIEELRRLRPVWEKRAQGGAAIFGHRFNDRATDWKTLRHDIEECQSIQQCWPNEIPGLLGQLLTGNENEEIDLAGIKEEWTAIKTSLETAGRLLSDVNADFVKCRLPQLVLTGRFDGYCKSLAEAYAYVTTVTDARNALLPKAKIQSVSDLLAAYEVQRELDQKNNELRKKREDWGALFGQRFNGADTDWDQLEKAIVWTEELVEHDALADIPPPNSVPPGVATRACKPDCNEIKPWIQRLEDTFTDSIVRYFDEESDGRTDREWPDLLKWIEHIVEHPNEADDRFKFRRAVKDLEKQLDWKEEVSVQGLLRHQTDDAQEIPKIIERAIAKKWLSEASSQSKLRNWDIDQHLDIRKQFRKLEKEFFREVQNDVRRTVFAGYRYATSGAEGNIGILTRETKKRKRQKPIRKLFKQAGMAKLLTTLKPCALMSPLAVSQFLPLDPDSFDVVIFDEASQVFPEDAMPAIARAKQVVVVGDEQQLPPTNFFRKQAEEEEIVDEELEDSDSAAGMASILDLMVSKVNQWNIGAEWLRVHYRSRDESLINFSNQKFYSDRPLIVFPGSRRDDSGAHPIRDIQVPDAVYEIGTRINKQEAEKVVELVFQLMRNVRTNNESIGVIALSRPQAQHVEECIELERGKNRDLDQHFSNERQEPFFVKNLENVQGDERDHIILTVGYGPITTGGRAPQRFGPLNQSNGGRRLNVAVSRARKSMSVVHALQSEQITGATRGATLLKKYLEYIANPDTYFAREVTRGDGEAESPFEAAVAVALRGKGYEIEPQVGVAGYRIDIGIPDGRGGYLLGIECDGYAYHSSPAARDRDWLRQDVLEGLGWKIHRVWSTAWVRNRERELQRIEEAVEEAKMVSLPLPPAEVVAEPRNEVDDSTDVPRGDEREETGLFEVFVRADLASLRVPTDSRGGDCDLATVTVEQLEPFVLEVVRKEGPVHFMEICDRIRERWGVTRSGSAIKKNIEETLDTMIKVKNSVAYLGETKDQQKQGRFVKEIGDSPVRPRRREDGGYERSIERVALEEIEAGLLCVCRKLFGCPRDQLRTRTRKEFGFNQTGPLIKRRIEKAIERLLDSGKVKDEEGQILSTGNITLVVDNQNLF